MMISEFKIWVSISAKNKSWVFLVCSPSRICVWIGLFEIEFDLHAPLSTTQDDIQFNSVDIDWVSILLPSWGYTGARDKFPHPYVAQRLLEISPSLGPGVWRRWVAKTCGHTHPTCFRMDSGQGFPWNWHQQRWAPRAETVPSNSYRTL